MMNSSFVGTIALDLQTDIRGIDDSDISIGWKNSSQS